MKTTRVKYFLSFISLLFLLPVSIIAQQVKEGYNKLYYPSGKLASEGTIRNGKPDGYWKSYYENGKLKSEGNRKDFKLDSLWKFYNAKGLMSESREYANDKKNGYRCTYEPSAKDSTVGVLVSKEFYRNDTLQGTAYYYKKGKLHQTIPYKWGLAEGKSYEFSPDSLITSIILYKGGFVKKVTKINQYNTEGRKEGLWQTFYPNEEVKWEGTYVDGKKDGYFKTYDEHGSMLTIEKYINDVLQNNPPELAKLETKTTYYPNGNVKTEGPYDKNDKPVGIHHIYNEDGTIAKVDLYDSGRIAAEGVLDSMGRQQGEWKEFYENGEVKSVGKYLNGNKVGEWKYFFADGKNFERGKYDNQGRQQGKWAWYFENGKLRRESNFYNGQEDGDFIEYTDTGSVITKGQYSEGLKEGVWFYVLGNYKEVGKYVDDQQDSIWKEYYVDNGAVRYEGNYTQGRPDGKHTWYYEDGKKQIEGQYSLGVKEDKWRYYDDNGDLVLTIVYKDDVEIKYDTVKIEPQ